MPTLPRAPAGAPVATPGKGQFADALPAAPPLADSRAAIPVRFVRLPGGRFTMGCDDSPLPADGEGPARVVTLPAFAIDPFTVTNRWFAAFVQATGHVTLAEREGWSAVFHLLLADADAHPAAAALPWWRKVPGACWHSPEGPGSGIGDRLDHPVVHVALDDALAFARWAGGRLPTEAEWEYAAGGGLPGTRFPWGDREPDDTGFQPCNIWQGRFPAVNTAADGHVGTAPVDSFAPNRFGLFNMAGNVWEWTADPFRIRSVSSGARLRNRDALAQRQRVIKGGSYLCHVSYCYRYRIAARTPGAPDTTTGHLGMRIVFDT